MKNIAVIGKHGQLSKAIAVRANRFNLNIIASYDIEDQDLTAPKHEISAFAKTLPETIEGLIIAAAYTAVDNAEDNPDIAHAINAVAPGVFADECAARNIPLVHVSTDYVFNGENDTPWTPEDNTGPINVYGKTKLDGENAIVKSGVRAAIHRTSWVYDGTGKNFMLTMLKLAETRDSLNIVNDQIGRPTYAGHLADACLTSLHKLITDDSYSGGTYHVSNTGDPISWADFAQAIFQAASNHIPQVPSVTGIPSSQYPTPASRPSYSVMDTGAFEATFHYNLPNWKIGLKDAILEWAQNQNLG
ncbi:MAG: dTDP-4-dehydrorhamnose reductase [Maricaulaceae bacterium]